MGAAASAAISGRARPPVGAGTPKGVPEPSCLAKGPPILSLPDTPPPLHPSCTHGEDTDTPMQGVTEPTPPTLGATEATGCPLGGAVGGLCTTGSLGLVSECVSPRHRRRPRATPCPSPCTGTLRTPQ